MYNCERCGMPTEQKELHTVTVVLLDDPIEKHDELTYSACRLCRMSILNSFKHIIPFRLRGY